MTKNQASFDAKKRNATLKKRGAMPKNKGGRPPIEIDISLAEGLARIHATGEEIAAVLKIDYDTLERHIRKLGHNSFTEWYKKYAGEGSASLRRRQWAMAMKDNITMLIWLGKQELGQTDKVDNRTPPGGAMALPTTVKIILIDGNKKKKD